MKFLNVPVWALLVLSLVACEPLHSLEEARPMDPALAKDNPLEPIKGFCEGSIPFLPTVVLHNPADFPGYDLVLEVGGAAEGVPPNCTCASTEIYLEMLLDVTQVQGLGLGSSNNPYGPVDVVFQNPGGFGSKYEAPNGLNAQLGPLDPVNPDLFQVAFLLSQGDLVLFDLDAPLPDNVSLSQVLDTAGGICIIDNIDNPNG